MSQIELCYKPPSVDSHVSGASKPRVQDINTAHCVRSIQGLLQRRIIVQPQTFAKPMHRIHHHDYFLFHVWRKIHCESVKMKAENTLI